MWNNNSCNCCGCGQKNDCGFEKKYDCKFICKPVEEKKSCGCPCCNQRPYGNNQYGQCCSNNY